MKHADTGTLRAYLDGQLDPSTARRHRAPQELRSVRSRAEIAA